jgi:hypothetical protein
MSQNANTGSGKGAAPNSSRHVVSREGAAIKVTKTPLTGDLKRGLTTSSRTFGKDGSVPKTSR